LNCLVLGGAGFIGKHLCRALVAAGHTVKSCDLPPPAGRSWPSIDGVTWLAGDIARAESMMVALADAEIVFHLVSTSIPKTSNDDPHTDLQKNVAASLRLFDAIVGLPHPPKILFVSSGGTVYGIPKTIPIPEDHPTDPLCAYGVGKLAIEKYLALYGYLHQLDYRILRMANPYGPEQPLSRGQGVIPVFLSKALRNEPLEIWGDGSVVRDYFHVDDLCAVLLATMGYDGPERIFNIGSGSGCSLNDLIAIIRRLLGREVTCHYLPGRACDVPVNILDISRAMTHLGWQPRVALDEGLAGLLPWLRTL
jgi:UDP-glucose 4-epimerase